jgi:YVTN family beta-propeller protein
MIDRRSEFMLRVAVGIVLVIAASAVSAESLGCMTAGSSAVYVSRILEGKVVVIDASTNEVFCFLRTGSNPTEVGVIGASQRAYVADLSDGTVSVIDTATHSIVEVIKLTHPVAAVGVDEPAGTVYAVDFSNGTAGTDLHVIDAATNQVSGIYTIGSRTQNIAVSSSNQQAYVTDFVDGLLVFDTTSKMVTDSLPLADLPHGIALNDGANQILVTHLEADTVSVIDAGTLSVVDVLGVGDTPQWVAFDPPRQKAFVTNEGDNTVSVISVDVTGGYTVHPAAIPVGIDPLTLTVEPSVAKVYVYNAGDATISIIDTVTETVVATIDALFSDGFECGNFVSWSVLFP